MVIDGKLVLHDGKLITVDEERIMREAQEAAERLIARREAFIPREYRFQGDFV